MGTLCGGGRGGGGRHRSVGSASNCRSRNRKFKSQLGNITFVETLSVEIGLAIISTANLHIRLIQEGELSVNGQSMWKGTG